MLFSGPSSPSASESGLPFCIRLTNPSLPLVWFCSLPQTAANTGWSRAEAPLSITQGFRGPGRVSLLLLLPRRLPVPEDRKCVCLEWQEVSQLIGPAVSRPDTRRELSVLAAPGTFSSLLLFPALRGSCWLGGQAINLPASLGSGSNLLCDLEQVPCPLWASVGLCDLNQYGEKNHNSVI